MVLMQDLNKQDYLNLELESKVVFINTHLNKNNGDYKSLDSIVWYINSKEEKKYLSSSFVTQPILKEYRYDRKLKSYIKKEQTKLESVTFEQYIIKNIFKKRQDVVEKKIVFKIRKDDKEKLEHFISSINLNKKTLLNYIYSYQISQLECNDILDNILECVNNEDNEELFVITFDMDLDTIEEIKKIYNELYYIKKEQIDIVLINLFLKNI